MRHYYCYTIKTLIWMVGVVVVMGLNGRDAFAQHLPTDNFYQIKEFNKQNFKSGTYMTEGYVAMIYQCPVCPEGAMCKPCMPDHIVISQKYKELNTYKLAFTELLVFVDDVEGFKIGEKYKFLVQVTDIKTVRQLTNNLKLIYFEKTDSVK